MQVILSGYVNKRQEILSDVSYLQLFLSEFTEFLGMQTKGDLKYELFDSVNDDPALRGISAVQFIYTSSLTLHTYPEYNFLEIDIFSCQHIDDAAIDWFTHQLSFETVDWVVLPLRGTFLSNTNSKTTQSRIPMTTSFVHKGNMNQVIA